MGCRKCAKPLPFKELAINVTIAGSKSLKRIATGRTIFTSENIQEARLYLCSKCGHLDKGLYRCALCGCFIKVKAKLIEERCPVKKW